MSNVINNISIIFQVYLIFQVYMNLNIVELNSGSTFTNRNKRFNVSQIKTKLLFKRQPVLQALQDHHGINKNG